MAGGMEHVYEGIDLHIDFMDEWHALVCRDASV
jgi:hypothetical protein